MSGLPRAEGGPGLPPGVEKPAGSRELAAILAGLRDEPPPAREGIDPARLLALADWHGVSGLLHSAWSRPEARAALPREVPETLARRHRRTLADNLLLLDRLRAAAARLREQEISFLVLKGAAALPLIYESLGQRPLADVDLLVAARDGRRAVECLRPLAAAPAGWRLGAALALQGKVETSTRTRPACALELHTRLDVRGRSRFPVAGVLAAADDFVLEEMHLRRPGPADMILHTALHLAQHVGGPRLIWAVDLWRLLRREGLAHEALETQARRRRMLRMWRYAMAACRALEPGGEMDRSGRHRSPGDGFPGWLDPQPGAGEWRGIRRVTGWAGLGRELALLDTAWQWPSYLAGRFLRRGLKAAGLA